MYFMDMGMLTLFAPESLGLLEVRRYLSLAALPAAVSKPPREKRMSGPPRVPYERSGFDGHRRDPDRRSWLPSR